MRKLYILSHFWVGGGSTLKKISFLFLILLLTTSACGFSSKVSGDKIQSTKTLTTFSINSLPKMPEKSIKPLVMPGKNFHITPPSYRVDPKTMSVVPIHSNTNKKVVLITIDDAPDQYALQMAKTLHALNVKAIFFVNGIYLKGDQKANELKQISDMGCMIGNHTFSHPNLSTLKPKQQKEEINSLSNRISTILGKPPVFFRAPYGVNTDTSREIAKEQGMLLMNWSYGYDWNKAYENKASLTNIMLTTPYLYNGAILLMHDRSWTSAALKDIILGLKKKGYSFVDPHDIEVPKKQHS